MKVYIITREPFPNGMAATNRILCYAKGWLSKDIDCEVIIYTRTERKGEKPKNTQGSGSFEGVEFRYIKGTPFREKNTFLRKFNDYYDRIRLKKFLRKNLKSNDIVFAYNGTDIKSGNIIRLVHSLGAKFAQEICELPFGTSAEDEKSKRNRNIFERKIMPKLDGVIAISDALVNYVSDKCSHSCTIVKVPILVDFERSRMNDRSEEADAPYIFHSGTLYQQKDGFLDMLEAFGKVARKQPDVRFYSTGRLEGTTHESEIKKIIADYGIEDQVKFLGYLSNEEKKEYLSKARFVIINKLDTLQNRYCFSTKLGEYMAASKPIITTNIGEATNWLEHGRDSFIIQHNDLLILSQAIKHLFEDINLCHKLGHNAQVSCSNYFSIESNAKILKQFAQVVSSQDVPYLKCN